METGRGGGRRSGRCSGRSSRHGEDERERGRSSRYNDEEDRGRGRRSSRNDDYDDRDRPHPLRVALARPPPTVKSAT